MTVSTGTVRGYQTTCSPRLTVYGGKRCSRGNLAWKDLLMRILAAILVLLTGAGCSSEEAPASSPSTRSPRAASTSSTEPDQCELLTTEEVARLVGGVGPGTAGMSLGTPKCLWGEPAGRVLMISSGDATLWVKSMVETTRILDNAGLRDSDRRKAVESLEADPPLDAREVCRAFSRLHEIEGEPANSPLIVVVTPYRATPLSIVVKMCRRGVYTLVAVSDLDGLPGSLRISDVKDAAKAVHRRTVG